MTRVLTYSSHVPRAWIEIHGCECVRIRPSGQRVHDSVARMEGLCPYTQAWVSDVLHGEQADAIVMTTCCDQMRRAFEVVERHAKVPCFLMNLPKVWQSESALPVYQEELKRLARFLKHLGGVEGNIKNSFVRPYDTCQEGTPLALIGSHGMVHDDRLKALIRQLGGAVVLDATESEVPVNTQENDFDDMSRKHWQAMQEVFQRPNTRLYDRLSRLMSQTPVAGVIIRRYLWCDLWHAEVDRIKAWSPVPVLDIEISSPAQTDEHRLVTRLQAFLEMLR